MHGGNCQISPFRIRKQVSTSFVLVQPLVGEEKSSEKMIFADWAGCGVTLDNDCAATLSESFVT